MDFLTMTPGENELERLRAELAGIRAQTIHDQLLIASLQSQLRDHRREVQYQVRNLLSTVRSVARRTIAREETAEDYQVRLDSRLASITRVQGYILRYPDAGVDLAMLVAGELLAFDIDLGAGAQVEGAAICLKSGPASLLGLAFHELARLTIEGKSGSPVEGLTDVRWQVEGSGDGPAQLRIDWCDTGRGLSAASLANASFGHDILEQAIPYQLKGKVQLDLIDGDVLCSIRLPIDCTMGA